MGKADNIGGVIEFNYSSVKSESEDASGTITELRSSSFRQSYRLNMDKTIYPFLRLSAGGLFEKTVSDFKTEETEMKSSFTKINPFAGLTLTNPFFNAGIGYNRVEERQKSDGVSAPTNIRENYNAFLGLRPEGLPPMEIRLSRSNLFDKEKIVRDNITDSLLFSTRYGIKDFRLSYQFSYTDSTDRLKDFESKTYFHNGMATYSTRLFNDRTSLYTSYSVSRQEIQSFSRGVGGEVQIQLFPNTGLSGLDDTPNEGALDFNSALIDGNLSAGSGINIGVVPPGGDIRKRNMGIGFFADTEINTLFVYVDRELPLIIANSYSWSVYTSSDNQNWNLHTTLSSTFFDTVQRRFEIRFPNVKKSYVKVVTSPLSPVTAALVPDFLDPDRIFVTELQAFLTIPAKDIERKFTTTSHVYNLGVRTILLDQPSLFHDFFLWYNKTLPGEAYRFMISNGLTLSHRISRILFGNARVSIENGKTNNEETINYQYSASLTANPLETLSHNIVFSGRVTTRNGKSSDSNSVFLNNSAELYKGINVNLSGGISFTTSETGQKTTNTMVSFGSSIIPRKNLSLNMGYAETRTEQSGGEGKKSSSFTRSTFLSLAYVPFRTLYLFGSVDRFSQNDKKAVTTLNYAMTFSPFRDGYLLFNFAYNETFLLEEEEKTRTMTPSIRWNITRRSSLDLAYNLVRTRSSSEETKFGIFSANLRVIF